VTEPKTLILIPTLNERENVAQIVPQILGLGLDADLVFLDDDSPDGTGQLLDELAARHPRLSVIHRVGKSGIGSAHADGIRWAYDHGYERLLTMDCDFSHSPADIPRFLESSDRYDVTVGSRYMHRESLADWNLLRKFLTNFGHFLTRYLLRIEFDATGAFRLYNLARIPRQVFDLVHSHGYSFFFESLFVIDRNGFTILEIPILLPARTYGHSKMSFREAARSGRRVISMFLTNAFKPSRYRLKRSAPTDPALPGKSAWDSYWQQQVRSPRVFYQALATFYRSMVIQSALTRVLRKHFKNGSSLLHAGCGGGKVDQTVQKEMKITAVDLSQQALVLYQMNNPLAAWVRQADILELPFDTATFDGAYNLGVIEHFTDEQIKVMLSEFARVVKPNGKIVIFWPHRRSVSVMALKVLHWIHKMIFREEAGFHPPEISLLRSRSHARETLHGAGFEMIEFRFGAGDGFVQAIVIGQKR